MLPVLPARFTILLRPPGFRACLSFRLLTRSATERTKQLIIERAPEVALNSRWKFPLLKSAGPLRRSADFEKQLLSKSPHNATSGPMQFLDGEYSEDTRGESIQTSLSSPWSVPAGQFAPQESNVELGRL